MKTRIFENISEAKQFDLHKTINVIGTFADLMDYASKIYLFDTKFKLPEINYQRKRVIEGIKSIQTHMRANIAVKCEDALEERNIALFRVMDHFIEMSTSQIEEFMDGVDKMKGGNE